MPMPRVVLPIVTRAEARARVSARGEQRKSLTLLECLWTSTRSVAVLEGTRDEASDWIWTEPEEFEEIAHRLRFYAEGLEAAAQNGPNTEMASSGPPASIDDMARMPAAAVLTLVGGTCTACHKSYRFKR